MDQRDPEHILRIIKILQGVALVVVAANFWLAFSAYPGLPHIMAVHFNDAGNADSWATKSWGTVLMWPLVQLGILLSTVGISYWFISSPGSVSYINLPGIVPSRMSDDQKERLRFMSAQGFGIISLILVGLFTLVNYTTLQAELTGHNNSTAVMMIVSLLTPLLVIGVIAWMATAAG